MFAPAKRAVAQWPGRTFFCGDWSDEQDGEVEGWIDWIERIERMERMDWVEKMEWIEKMKWMGLGQKKGKRLVLFPLLWCVCRDYSAGAASGLRKTTR